MDFVTGLPQTPNSIDAMWIIVDKLTKSAHFLAYSVGHTPEKLANLSIKEIVRLHDIPVTIVFDRDTIFISQF